MVKSTFDTWAENADFNSRSQLPPGLYGRCWHYALARCAILLNNTGPQGEFSKNLLANDDEFISKHIPKGRAHDLYTISLSEIDQATNNETLNAEDIATNFFYGSFNISRIKCLNRLNYQLPMAFLDYSYRGLHFPRRYNGSAYSYSELNLDKNSAPIKVISECAANYLVRNFWHNITHVLCQNIQNHNFRDFRGPGRYQSDFAADNLSLILLTLSYGLPVKADNTSFTLPDKNIVSLFRRNRANELFRLRSQTRNEQSSFEEEEWRRRRTIAGYLSGWLIAQGLTVADISIQPTGSLEVDNQKIKRIGHGFSIALNGIYIAHKTAFPDENSPQVRAEYLRALATTVTDEYRNLLKTNLDLKASSKAMLHAALRKFGKNVVELL